MNDWEYIEKEKVTKKIVVNRLKEVRVRLGLTITALSKTANVSTKVISQTERMLKNPTQVTKHKIIQGLNIGMASAEKKISYENIFPKESE